MFCHKCGKEIPDDSEFCRYCGTALNNSSDNSVSSTSVTNTIKEQPVNNAPQGVSKKELQKKPLWKNPLIIAVVLVAVIVGCFFIIRPMVGNVVDNSKVDNSKNEAFDPSKETRRSIDEKIIDVFSNGMAIEDVEKYMGRIDYVTADPFKGILSSTSYDVYVCYDNIEFRGIPGLLRIMYLTDTLKKEEYVNTSWMKDGNLDMDFSGLDDFYYEFYSEQLDLPCSADNYWNSMIVFSESVLGSKNYEEAYNALEQFFVKKYGNPDFEFPLPGTIFDGNADGSHLTKIWDMKSGNKEKHIYLEKDDEGNMCILFTPYKEK